MADEPAKPAETPKPEPAKEAAGSLLERNAARNAGKRPRKR